MEVEKLMARRPMLTLFVLVLAAGLVQAGVTALAPPAEPGAISCSACGPLGQGSCELPSGTAKP